MNRSRFTLFALVPAVLLIGLAAFMARTHRLAKDVITSRYEERVDNRARFIGDFAADRYELERKTAIARFAGPHIDPAQFDLAVETLGFDAAVLLDDKGRLLGVFPNKPEIIGTEIASRYVHLSQALAGRRAASGVVPSAARGIPVVALAMPFETTQGRRVFSGAFSVEVGPLRGFFRGMVSLPGSQVFLVDASGGIAASDSTPQKKIQSLQALEPTLFRAVSSGGAVTARAGSYEEQGSRRRFLSRAVPGTSWHLVATVSEEVLYGPLSSSGSPQWVIFVGLVIAATLGLYLMARLHASRVQLQLQIGEQERLNKALEDFSSRVAHDLRSPLAQITMADTMLDDPRLDEKDRSAFRGSVRRQALKATDLVNDLLDLARASGTARRQQLRTADLLRTIDEDVDEVTINVGAVPEYVDADPISFRQAILNLVRNAGKYGSSNGMAIVEVQAETTDEGVVFSFADRGPGLPESQREGIFEAFQRGGNKDQPGTGLGLAIVGATAQAHGGRAWYEDHEGGGAVFKILIADA